MLILHLFSNLDRNPQHALPVLCCTDRKQNPVVFKQLFTSDPCYTVHASIDVSSEVQVSRKDFKMILLHEEYSAPMYLYFEGCNILFNFASYVFIPILPAALLEFLSAPTPYIMGVHESYKDTLTPDLVSDSGFISYIFFS